MSDGPPVHILLVEPYFTGSHRAWAEGYAQRSRHQVSLVTHEGRFWKWRMQGAPLTMASEIADVVAGKSDVDVVIASSMTDLATLLGLTRKMVAGARTVLYMHENQLTYPPSPRDEPDATYAMINWRSMAAADLVVFNSDFHRSEWFTAVPAFLRNFPDYRHEPMIDEVASRAEVLPVGIDLARLDGTFERADVPLILWNQRCEHDKGPDEFVTALLALDERGADFAVALAGERFVSEPSAFDQLRTRLGHRIVHDGYADEATYVDLLRRAGIVVSTALQEFYGVAITEAIYAGAFPILPDRLVYPERIPPAFHGDVLYRTHGELVDKLEWAIAHMTESAAIAERLRPLMAESDWSAVAPRYDAVVASISD